MTSRSNFLRCRVPVVAAALVLLAAFTPAVGAERPPASRLLPESTLVMVSITDVPELADKFMNTSIGRLTQDPQMKPLLSDLYQAIEGAMAEAEEEIGMSLSELLKIPQGEVTFAMLPTEVGSDGITPLLLIDVGKQLPNARKLVERGVAELEKSGAKKTEETVAGTKIITFERGGPDPVSYFEKDGTFAVAMYPDVLKQMLEVWDGGEGKTLSDNRSFSTIMRRCSGSQDERPQIIAYVDPIGLMHLGARGNTGAQIFLAMLPPLGLDGLKGIGGSVIFDAGQFESVMHLHVLLEAPRSGVIKMVAFKPGNMTPERWVPKDVAGYMTLHWDVETTYKELAKVFDSFYNEGAFAQFAQQPFQQFDVDFEKELMPALEGRLTYITWFERPVTVISQNHLVAVKLNETKVVEDLLDKLAERFPNAMTREKFGGKEYFQVVIGPPTNDPDSPVPTACWGVLDGYLMAAYNVAIYKQAISTLSGSSGSLADELDFKLIASKIKRQPGGKQPAMIGFGRPEETMRFLYDLATAEESRTTLRRVGENSPFLKSVDAALENNPLPPFSVIRRYLAPTGSMIVDDNTGLHIMQFSLRRNAE